MKKNYKTMVALLSLSGAIYAQQPEWNWAKSAQNTQGSSINTMAVDEGGSLYSGGIFGPGLITFDGHTAVNTNMGSNMYIVKHNADGVAQWINKASSQQCYLTNIATDADGNVYGVGYFMHNIVLGDIFLSSPSTWSMVLFRIESNGNYTWAKNFGESHRVTPGKITIDADGNIYVAGSFSCPTVNFDDITLTRTGLQDAFITKFDNHGNVIWAKSAGVSGLSSADAVAVDADSNVYISGHFGAVITLGDDTFNSTGSYDSYIAKYSAEGNVIWAKTFGGNDFEAPDNMVVDTAGNIIMSGEFYSSSLNFNGTLLTNTGEGADVFLVKYDPDGDIVWSKGLKGSDQDNVGGLTFDNNNNIVITGSFKSPSLDIDGTILQNNFGNRIYLASFKADGTLKWTEHTGGTGANLTTGIVVDSDNNIYTGGRYSHNISFGGNALTAGSNAIAFIAKFAMGTLSTQGYLEEQMNLYPNPAENVVYLNSLFAQKHYIIYDITGKKVQSGYMENNSITISGLAKGTYILQLSNGPSSKFIKE